MKTTKISSIEKKFLGDMTTPVEAYLKLRDRYKQCILLESSEYNNARNAHSILAMEPLLGFEVNSGKVYSQEVELPEVCENYKTLFNQAFESFETLSKSGFDPCALFGYNTFESAELMDEIQFSKKEGKRIPEVKFDLYRYVILFDHFNNQVTLFENGESPSMENLNRIHQILMSSALSQHSFQKVGNECSVISDQDFIASVQKGIAHVQRGDVFQIVLSREFTQPYSGDEFTLYRALRSINPSPYLFYFDYSDFKLMGSSPEAQLRIADGTAEIHPIAGTCLKTGEAEQDKHASAALMADVKEQSEHVMLVDLARNDLNRTTQNVQVETFQELQEFSHVFHLVSKVTGQVNGKSNAEIMAATFPAGTLSGAPKIRAMELINDYEKVPRSFYGGSIGMISKGGDLNQAILIRSFLAKEGRLYYQAGAGVVALSKPENELQEVNNKVAALRKAIKMAEEIC